MIRRSALTPLTAALSVAELLAGLGSGVAELTLTVLVRFPAALGVTKIVTEVLENRPSVFRLQFTVLVVESRAQVP